MDVIYDRDTHVFTVTGGCVRVRYTELGVLANNVFLIDDGDGGVIVVDPSTRPDVIQSLASDQRISAIFVTHGHYDHIGALAELRRETKAPVYASIVEEERITDPAPGGYGITVEPTDVDVLVKDGDTIEVGKTTWKVLSTPGHTPGSICFFAEADCGSEEGAPVLVAGDTLFCRGYGRTDLEGGDAQAMKESLAKLSNLPDETIVLPGHNSMTSIASERRFSLGSAN